VGRGDVADLFVAVVVCFAGEDQVTADLALGEAELSVAHAGRVGGER